jgi:predicted amidophosphoribosyltransferase
MLQKLLFSPLCRGCRNALEAGEILCFSCRRGIFHALGENSDYLLKYEGPVPALFHGLRREAPYFTAALILALLRRSNQFQLWQELGIEVVVAAPQRAQDGISGLVLVAEGLAVELGAEYAPELLEKEAGRTQHGLDFSSRVDTHCFVKIKKGAEMVRGKAVLLIDDVLTTGTTLELSAYVLRRAGAKSVNAFALAHQVLPGFVGKSEQAHEESGEVSPLRLHLSV